MAKDKKTDYSKLTLGTKIPITKTETEVKTPVVAAPKAEKTEKMEKAVSIIHAEKRSTQTDETHEIGRAFFTRYVGYTAIVACSNTHENISRRYFYERILFGTC